MLKIAAAVQHAHNGGIIHRDLKPSNIIIDKDDEPMVMDFGLAKDTVTDTELTLSGDLVGTPAYMSPEQVQGRPVDVRSDVFALGAIMYTLLTGKLPFDGARASVLFKVAHRDPEDPSALNPALTKDLETICLMAMRKEPDERYPTAGDMAVDLGGFLTETGIRAKPESGWKKFVRRGGLKKVGVAVALVAILAAGVFGMSALFSDESAKSVGAGASRPQPAPQQTTTRPSQSTPASGQSSTPISEVDELVLAKKYDEAIKRCRELLAANPDQKTQETLNQRLQWIDRLRKASTTPSIPPPATPGPTAANELAKADELLTQGNYDEAIALYQTLLSGSLPDSEKADVNRRLEWARQLKDQLARTTRPSSPVGGAGQSAADGDRLLRSHRLEEAAAAYRAGNADKARQDLAQALIAFRGKAAKALGAGQWRPITLKSGERPTLCALGRSAATFADAGGTVRPRRWDAIAPEDIYTIYKACFSTAGADEHMGLGALCVSLGLTSEARQEFAEAARLDVGKKAESDRYQNLPLAK